MTSYHPVDDSVLCNFDVGDYECYKGSELAINLMFFIWQIDISFWWNVKEKHYGKQSRINYLYG